MKQKISIMIIFLLLLLGFTFQENTVLTGTTAIGAGSSATITSIPIQILNADSVAFQLEVNKTDVSATITYQYLTKGGKNNNEPLTSLPSALVLDSGQTGAFGTLIPMLAGHSKLKPYLIIENKGATQSVEYAVIVIKRTQ